MYTSTTVTPRLRDSLTVRLGATTRAAGDWLFRAPWSAPADWLALVVILILAVGAPLAPLATNRFHYDEAVYSQWALDVASGRDVLLSASPVDKPPLFPYLQALSLWLFGVSEAAARLPSLIASVTGVLVLLRLGQCLYGRSTGILAAGLWAASPFYILFAPTAFTDPLMTTLVLVACLAVARGHWGRAGLCWGLGAITKPQALIFGPLIWGLGRLVERDRLTGLGATSAHTRPTRVPGWCRLALGLLLISSLALVWDVCRNRQPGFIEQSLISYGDLGFSLMDIGKRLSGFMGLLAYVTGAPLLNRVLLIGLPVLAAVDGWQVWSARRVRGDGARETVVPARVDLLLLAFVVGFVVLHVFLPFQVWDRYLLGIVPCLALLLARLLSLPWRMLQAAPLWRERGNGRERLYGTLRLGYLLVVLAVIVTLLWQPVQDAAASRFPIGGDHGAYQGIEQVVAFFRTVPADTTLYHRWLGGHWRFYLWNSPYDLRAWQTPGDLATQAAARPNARRYVVFPSWQSSTETRLALAEVGLTLRELHRAFRDDGSLSFIVYAIEELK